MKKQILHYVGKFFGFRAKMLENTNQYEKIEGCTSCQSCFQTYAFARTYLYFHNLLLSLLVQNKL